MQFPRSCRGATIFVLLGSKNLGRISKNVAKRAVDVFAETPDKNVFIHFVGSTKDTNSFERECRGATLRKSENGDLEISTDEPDKLIMIPAGSLVANSKGQFLGVYDGRKSVITLGAAGKAMQEKGEDKHAVFEERSCQPRETATSNRAVSSSPTPADSQHHENTTLAEQINGDAKDHARVPGPTTQVGQNAASSSIASSAEHSKTDGPIDSCMQSLNMPQTQVEQNSASNSVAPLSQPTENTSPPTTSTGAPETHKSPTVEIERNNTSSPTVLPTETAQQSRTAANPLHQIPSSLGDLQQHQLSQIANKIEGGSCQGFLIKLRARLKQEERGLRELLNYTKDLPIREFTELLKSENRKDVIEDMRTILPHGSTGPLLVASTNIRDIKISIRQDLTRQLCVNERWKHLAEEIKMKPTDIHYFAQMKDNPAEEVLKFWEVKLHSTVKHLYDMLVRLGYHVIADTL